MLHLPIVKPLLSTDYQKHITLWIIHGLSVLDLMRKHFDLSVIWHKRSSRLDNHNRHVEWWWSDWNRPQENYVIIKLEWIILILKIYTLLTYMSHSIFLCVWCISRNAINIIAQCNFISFNQLCNQAGHRHITEQNGTLHTRSTRATLQEESCSIRKVYAMRQSRYEIITVGGTPCIVVHH